VAHEFALRREPSGLRELAVADHLLKVVRHVLVELAMANGHIPHAGTPFIPVNRATALGKSQGGLRSNRIQSRLHLVDGCAVPTNIVQQRLAKEAPDEQDGRSFASS
jgi:hypothetical protein